MRTANRTSPRALTRSLLDRFIAEQVQFEEDRRQSIQARGTTVLTASGSLVTLILMISPIAVPAFKAGSGPPPGRCPGTTSDHEFDACFRGKIEEAHGMDFAAPPPPPAEQRL